jgi:hypothetical protein
MYQLRAEPVEKNTASLNLLKEELRAFPDNARFASSGGN